jgi:hypothetical protein
MAGRLWLKSRDGNGARVESRPDWLGCESLAAVVTLKTSRIVKSSRRISGKVFIMRKLFTIS